jgi:hypothetical protein
MVMNGLSGNRWWNWLILGLAAIGFATQLWHSPESVLLPVAVAGIVWYLYKSPPRWLIRIASSPHPAFHRRKENGKSAKKKKRPFRVIDGKKKETL